MVSLCVGILEALEGILKILGTIIRILEPIM